jgi:hypothetical protein
LKEIKMDFEEICKCSFEFLEKWWWLFYAFINFASMGKV